MKTPPCRDEVIADLHALIKRQLDLGDHFGTTSDLAGNGLDSLAMVRVFFAIEEKFGVWLEVGELKSEHLRNVETLADRILACGPS